MYCFLRYESSKDLSDAILDNWLVNLTGVPGHCYEGDLLQEHYNKWTEDMVGRRGGDFNDPLHRDIISPNVDLFLRFKEYMQDDFNIKRRSKSHTSPHLRDEYSTLLRLYKEEELHKFVSGRTMGHAAVNLLNNGYTRLESGGKMKSFLARSTEYASVLGKLESQRVSIHCCT